MKVRMREDHSGSEDGVTVQRFSAGIEYEVGDYLGEVMVREGVAERVGARGRKRDGGPTENKQA